jgi:hypothetical protein
MIATEQLYPGGGAGGGAKVKGFGDVGGGGGLCKNGRCQSQHYVFEMQIVTTRSHACRMWPSIETGNCP